MCGGGGGIFGGLLSSIFGKPKEPDLPKVEAAPIPALPTAPDKDPEARKKALAARKRALASARRTQTVHTSDTGLGGSGAAPTLKSKLGGN